MFITKKTFEDIQEKYRICSKHQFTLFSGGIGVGKTMYAKAIAAMLADSSFFNKIPSNWDSEYCSDYLSAAYSIGAAFEKTYADHLENIEFLSMHPGYSYDNFVYGIQVQTKDEKLEINKAERIFIEMIERAGANRNQNFVIILDDFSRADIASTMGDLLSALESHGDAGVVRTDHCTYQIPPNLFIIATVNPSVCANLIDMAWYRRFIVIDFFASDDFFDIELLETIEKQPSCDAKLKDYIFLAKYECELYRHVELLTEHYYLGAPSDYLLKLNHIGHGLFMYFDRNCSLKENLIRANDLLTYRIAPLLEYSMESGKMDEMVQYDIIAMKHLWDKNEEFLTCEFKSKEKITGLYDENKNLCEWINACEFRYAAYFFLFHAADRSLIFEGKKGSKRITPRMFFSELASWYNANGDKIKINSNFKKQPNFTFHSTKNSYANYNVCGEKLYIPGGTSAGGFTGGSDEKFYNQKNVAFDNNMLTEAITERTDYIETIEKILF